MSGREKHRRFLGTRLLRSLLKDREGVTAVEFSMVALPFFIIVFGIMEVGITMFVGRMVDNSVISASRLIRTGQAHTSGLTASQFKSQICDFMPAFMCDTDRIVVEVESVDSFAAAGSTDSLYDADGNLKEDDDLTYDIGGAGKIVVVKVIYKWPMMTAALNLALDDSGTERFLTSTMVFRNEPWE
ncbi:MAG: pilus assembly protein [Roseibium album]|uniref:TadE/TadG family type IV pilus assembly protein n=1 Tax=Roseibium album TaxID=311410 RepID=UPI000CF17E9C|nr:TadE/TadG family type IV pilus assembly protein [Roseibium album]MBG6145859.1 Flp pilus assembly protein TadG [Labrenzia sp. EL_142]MBG6154706.1 Flp pilus assembly protein TadG [Labrenzia sp. EL_162]MBG6161985.1 Flp pilus assembly protein TadG [Labrenzia sp. EL_195]MBG6193164.1 Flp pilus assembly protein TadG [Labrenzia sp. EL_159]MBG6211308.1 Flp pilus assembly protein TadG [Labrenzia sp. EL_126]MCR9061339.1 pilus assembly protein [Paracoccaceae bacterium]